MDILARNQHALAVKQNVEKVDRELIRSQVENFLSNLERVAILWDLLDKNKYRYRIQNYGQFDSDINLIPRKNDNYQTAFQLKTLITSCAKPFAHTKNGERISKAGKEYFHHAAKLQLRYLETLTIIKRDLQDILFQKKPSESTQFFQTITSWFSLSQPATTEVYEADEHHPILKDKLFIKRLKTEIKHFEICLRLFEQTCIATIIAT